MPRRGSRGRRLKRHGARESILEILRALGSSATVTVSELQRRIAERNGRTVPRYSLYNALRTLTRRGEVSGRREGREYAYRLAPAAGATMESRTPAARPGAGSAASIGRVAIETLGLGEIAILEVGSQYVETAKNEHGRLVLERHRRPAR
jgi:hypothetical protein